MAIYRKRPVEVEAEQFDGTPECAKRLTKKYKGIVWPRSGGSDPKEPWTLWIRTAEAVLIVHPGEWIVNDIAGGHYPCSDEQFTLIYELVTEDEEGTA